jgi:hypothetical protein
LKDLCKFSDFVIYLSKFIDEARISTSAMVAAPVALVAPASLAPALAAVAAAPAATSCNCFF